MCSQQKLDLKQQWKQFYQPSNGEITTVNVPAFSFLMVDGQGDPNTAPAYQQAVEALFSLSYTLMFSRKAGGQPYSVMPLEGLWWADDPMAFTSGDRALWKWTAMILQPEFITPADMEAARSALRKKKKDIPALDLLRLEEFTEGPSLQTLHIGPYSAEAATIARMHEQILSAGRQIRGKHHEIYLSDPRRTPPEKLKTILRQPYS
jgi:hypothetical protein